MQDYNTIVNFKLEEELVFEDFSLKFVKYRTVPGPNNAKWTMKFWDFEVYGELGVKQLHWSSGTGRITPLSFTYNNVEFRLILKILKTNKPNTPFTFVELEKDQLVIQKLNK
ncbi:hypothetical protein EGM88_09315 [Aureibaculum marinum]|uniref:Uncharacterized protein n=1 Tax=Aureibaculum marinum TaxID=2487930 RepID=A0A3N4NU54_9FLAO|nr:hypothetical protein [Aureibaculum marinum]RPD96556.1 hypothetical protein EGM88_09315 [Aureibaculum marinum]